MFHRITFGERLENEERHNIKVSGSRGSREMTFVIGKVYSLTFNLITDRKVYFSKTCYFIIYFGFFVEKTYRNETP